MEAKTQQTLSETPKTLVVLPTYNEAKNIERLIKTILDSYPGIHIFVVDDNSPDGTGNIVKAITETSTQVHFENRPTKLGLGTAYRYAFTQKIIGDFDFIIQMDSDLSHDPLVIGSFIDHLSSGADMVIGSRYVPGGSIPNWSLLRRALSKYGNYYIRYTMGIPIKDCTSGYRGFKRTALLDIEVQRVPGEGYVFIAAMARMAHQKNCRMIEIPITFHERSSGKSKMSKRIIFESLFIATKVGIQNFVKRNR